mmetsp:Transcript_3326/g.7396  ORF Transcript_3326/g.7396 Transcript_3326/m.7396 type:complete len:389 (+) Transcript_3326:829-1995(+)
MATTRRRRTASATAAAAVVGSPGVWQGPTCPTALALVLEAEEGVPSRSSSSRAATASAIVAACRAGVASPVVSLAAVVRIHEGLLHVLIHPPKHVEPFRVALQVAHRPVGRPHLLAHQVGVPRDLHGLPNDLRIAHDVTQFWVPLHHSPHLGVALDHRPDELRVVHQALHRGRVHHLPHRLRVHAAHASSHATKSSKVAAHPAHPAESSEVAEAARATRAAVGVRLLVVVCGGGGALLLLLLRRSSDALHKVNGVAGLYVVALERLLILQNVSLIDKPLPLRLDPARLIAVVAQLLLQLGDSHIPAHAHGKRPATRLAHVQLENLRHACSVAPCVSLEARSLASNNGASSSLLAFSSLRSKLPFAKSKSDVEIASHLVARNRASRYRR